MPADIRHWFVSHDLLTCPLDACSYAITQMPCSHGPLDSCSHALTMAGLACRDRGICLQSAPDWQRPEPRGWGADSAARSLRSRPAHYLIGSRRPDATPPSVYHWAGLQSGSDGRHLVDLVLSGTSTSAKPSGISCRTMRWSAFSHAATVRL
jgi:hypothetical protein